MWSRREFLLRTGATLGVFALSGKRANLLLEPLIAKADLDFLREMAQATIASATRKETEKMVGFPLITPGGNYPSYWIRDFSMGAGCGLIPTKAIQDHLRLAAQCQNGPAEQKLQSGAILPPYAIPDHITFQGKAVFYPGTYSPGEDQGGEPWGVLPPVDDHYEFIHLAYLIWKKTRDRKFLDEIVAGIPFRYRLLHAFESPKTDPLTGLVVTESGRRAVGFGFCDGIYFTGSLLFASLLRFRALTEMIEMLADLAPQCRLERSRIQASIPKTFLKDGWLIAATGVGRQPDVWGTAYANYLGVLQGNPRKETLQTLAKAYRGGTIAYQGAVRHVPTDHDFSSTSAWEKTAGEALNRYQNGAYWHVPTGWLASCLNAVDPTLARQLIREAVAHFRAEDFRKPGGGAPWECFHPSGHYRQNPVYMASITLLVEFLSAA